MTISQPIQIVALVAVVLVLGAGAFVLLDVGHDHAAKTTSLAPKATAHHVATATHNAVQAPRHAHAAVAAVQPDSLPSPLTHALRHHPVVVAVLYAPGVSNEAGTVALARKGARSVHAGFVSLNVRNEKIAESVALRFPGAFDPAVLIVKRGGIVVTELDGVQQSAAVAQAALDART